MFGKLGRLGGCLSRPGFRTEGTGALSSTLGGCGILSPSTPTVRMNLSPDPLSAKNEAGEPSPSSTPKMKQENRPPAL